MFHTVLCDSPQVSYKKHDGFPCDFMVGKAKKSENITFYLCFFSLLRLW